MTELQRAVVDRGLAAGYRAEHLPRAANRLARTLGERLAWFCAAGVGLSMRRTRAGSLVTLRLLDIRAGLVAKPAPVCRTRRDDRPRKTRENADPADELDDLMALEWLTSPF